jgi:hypothetical protein
LVEAWAGTAANKPYFRAFVLHLSKCLDIVGSFFVFLKKVPVPFLVFQGPGT